MLHLVYWVDCAVKGGSLYSPMLGFLYVALNSSTEYETSNCLTSNPFFFLPLSSAFHLSVLSFTRLTSRYYYEKHLGVRAGLIILDKCH